MQCACVVSPDIGNGSLWNKSRHVIAKRDFKCVECNRTIPSGDKFLIESVRWEYGEHPEIYATCEDCESVRDVLFCDWVYSCMWENLQTELEELLYDGQDGVPWAALPRLTDHARWDVLQIIEEIWESN
jgi:hypothetical protein